MPLLQVFQNKHVLTADQIQEIRNAASVETGEARLVAGYEVVSKLGQGGMGAVYKAKSQTTGQFVALKVLPPSLATPDLVKRFKREAAVVSKLEHDHIVGCIEFGYDKRRKVHFCALELVEGEDLDRRISALGTIPEKEAVRITMQVAEALQHAFFNGLLHRDIKPANIMVTADGTAKLLDLGLAREANAEITRLTQTGAFVGSPYYASPEQATGSRDVDIRSDIYSLGCTLYHMVTGKPPFSGTTVLQVLQKHLTEKMPWPQETNPDLSEGICRIIAKMMAKSPADRYQDPNELLADIDTHLEGGEPEITEEALKGSSVNVPVVVRKRLRERRRAARPLRESRRVRSAPRGKRHSAGDDQPEQKKSQVGMMVGVAAVVVIVLGMGVAMLGGKKKLRERPPVSPSPPETPAARPGRKSGDDTASEAQKRAVAYQRAAAEALRKAREFEEQNPHLRSQVIRMYEDVVRKFRATPAAREAAARLFQLKRASPGYDEQVDAGNQPAPQQTGVVTAKAPSGVDPRARSTPPESAEAPAGIDLSRGLVGWWKFDEKAGGVARDSSGKGNDGKFIGTPTWEAGFVGTGSIGCRAGYIQLPDIQRELTSEATLSLWIKLDSPARIGQGIFLFGTGQGTRYVWENGRFYVSAFRDDRPDFMPPGTPARDVWHHMAITNAPGAGNWKVYLNGAEVYSTTGKGVVNLRKDGRIGHGGGSYADGNLDDVRIYDRALSAEEVKALYGTGGEAKSTARAASSARPAHVPADAVEFAGGWYKLFTQNIRWHEAKAFCEKQSGHLVTIASKEENDFVVGLAREAAQNVWIGFTDKGHEGRWEWVTGEKSSFHAWSPGQPDNINAAEHWAFIHPGARYGWHDWWAQARAFALCEWEPEAEPSATPADLARGLVGWWKFDEGEGSVARDSSGKGNHGKLVGKPTWRPTGGRVGGACSFDGNDFIQTAMPGPHNTDLTWSAWIKTTCNGGPILANTRDGWTPGGKCLFIAGGKLGLDVHGVGIPATGFAVDDDSWHHVSLTVVNSGKTTDTVRIYADGVERKGYASWDFYKHDGTSLSMRIGNCVGKGGAFEGLMDDVRIYSRALSAEEIKTLYEQPQKRESAEGARAELSRSLDGFEALVAKVDYAGARKHVEDAARGTRTDSAGDARNPEHVPVFQAAARVAGALVERARAVQRGAEALVGKDVKLATTKGSQSGRATKVTDAGVVLKVKKTMRGMGTVETTVTVKWSDLAPDEGAKLARKGGWKAEDADHHVALALLARARKDTRSELAALREAGDHPLAAYLRKKMEAARRERSARLAWSSLRAKARMKKLSSTKSRALVESIDKFKKQHGGTDFAASIADELAQFKLRALVLGRPGLLGTYFADKEFQKPVLRRVDPQVNFNWKTGPPAPGVPADGFSVRWEGFVIPPSTGQYAFRMRADNAATLWVGGRETLAVVWDGKFHASKPVPLRAGEAAPVKLEHAEHTSGAMVEFFWTGPGIPEPVPVPTECLRPPVDYEKLPGPPITK